MKTWAWVISSLSLVAVIVMVAVDFRTHRSPGPLSRAHERSSELAGDAGCIRCHGVAGDGFAEGCTAECHSEIRVQLAGGLGFHSALAPEIRSDCHVCHVEHHGDAVPLVAGFSFERAGFAAPSAYRHEDLGYVLTGRHQTLPCVRCHPHADEDEMPPGGKRYLGLEQRCTACHEDAHRGALGVDCARCHGQDEPFPQAARFPHTDAFPLNGAHAARKCIDCHAPDGDRAIPNLLLARDTGTLPEVRGCVECHGSPHEFPADTRVAIADARDCARCHDTTSFAGRGFSAADHAAIGVVLTGAHGAASCAGCHHAKRPPSSSEQRAGVMDRCEGCHADPHHDATLAARTGAPRFKNDIACVECHTTQSFALEELASGQHDRYGFVLRGPHMDFTCTRCHGGAAEEAGQAQASSLSTMFVAWLDGTGPCPAGTADNCAGCHTTPHGAGYLRALADQKLTAGVDSCVECHGPEDASFAGAATRMDAARHAPSGFVLTQPHADLDCASCHRSSDAATFASRFPGRAADQCATCHRDPHGGEFSRGPYAGDGCVACHGRTHFTPPDFPPELHARTGFLLDGGHARVECGECHKPGADAKPSSPRRFDGVPRECSSCHRDPHHGVFDAARVPQTMDGQTGCARCHTVGGFSVAKPDEFDHGRWTAFPLEGAHGRLECETCHPDTPAAARPRRESTCASCHRDPHAGQFADKGGCDRCHSVLEPFTSVRFDHNHDSRFALDATHASLPCARCHVPVADAEGKTVVRYKPMGVECQDCHGGVRQRAGK